VAKHSKITALAATLTLMLGVSGPRAQSTRLYPVTDCSGLTVQTGLNECAGTNYEAADAALNKLYRQQMAEDADSATKLRLFEAERAWISYRDKECAYQVGPQQEGGSIWPMEMSNCLEQMTAARIRELTKLRGCTAGVSVCNPH
jgi:uncharacterized protein YecT (DUF1311 family)